MLQNASATARRCSRLACRISYQFNSHSRRNGELRLTSKISRASAFNLKALKRSYLHTEAGGSLGRDNDTIYALSTASGRAGIAVVRISGPSCLNVGDCQGLDFNVLISIDI